MERRTASIAIDLRRARRMAVAGVLVVAAVLAALLFWRWPSPDPDLAHLAAERSRRLAESRNGAMLPGTPDLARLDERLDAQGLKLGAQAFIRIFKREFELELWLRNGSQFELFATYPICRFSGALGPKLAEGDHQSPEGFYAVDARALNPRSRWHRSFNLGFPNAFDKSHGRTGTFLMVHGGCSSVGCYAMTNPVIDEIWRIIGAALKRGQGQIHVHVFPFRMTTDALSARQSHPWAPFWQQLKPGYDAFEDTRLPPRVAVCQGRYRIARSLPDRPAPARLDCKPEFAGMNTPATLYPL